MHVEWSYTGSSHQELVLRDLPYRTEGNEQEKMKFSKHRSAAVYPWCIRDCRPVTGPSMRSEDPCSETCNVVVRPAGHQSIEIVLPRVGAFSLTDMSVY